MTKQEKNNDRFIPWYFVAFFISIAIVYTIMATLAIKTQTGVVIKNPYESGLNYNKIIDAANSQALLGWQGKIEYINKANNNGLLKFSLKDKEGNPINADKVYAKIIRPTKQNMDFTLTLKSLENGNFLENIIFPQSGLWQITIYASYKDLQYQITNRIVVK